MSQIIFKSIQIKPTSKDDLLEKFSKNELIGLENVKKTFRINKSVRNSKERTWRIKNTEITLHTVFLGPPGTGKTLLLDC
jgi:AAA+ superfamily predicted ATPase